MAATESDTPLERQRTARALRRARGGDPDGLRELYVRYAPEVHRYVRGIVGTGYDAEDVTQQVFLKLATRPSGYEPTQATFAAWLLRVARNAAIDHVRRRRLIPVAVPAETKRLAHGVPERSRSLREAIDRLPPTQREVLLLRDVAGLTPSEVARRLGKSRGAVNTCHHRARAAARQTLESDGWAPVTRAAAAAQARAVA